MITRNPWMHFGFVRGVIKGHTWIWLGVLRPGASRFDASLEREAIRSSLLEMANGLQFTCRYTPLGCRPGGKVGV
jgi:hypothetical protein